MIQRSRSGAFSLVLIRVKALRVDVSLPPRCTIFDSKVYLSIEMLQHPGEMYVTKTQKNKEVPGAVLWQIV